MEDRDEKYATWMPPENSESNQEKLREKFAGKYWKPHIHKSGTGSFWEYSRSTFKVFIDQ